MKNVHLPIWVKGILIGELFWGLALLGQVTELPLCAHPVCAIIASPIGPGVWMLIWGDNGSPYEWIQSWIFFIGSSMTLYGLLGALIALALARCSTCNK